MKDSDLHIRINKELLEQLKIKAEEENRTMSNLVEKLIKDYLKGEKKMKRLNEVQKFLENKSVEEKDYFGEYFELGSYTHQEQSEEKNIELEDGSIFTQVLNTYDYASITLFDKDDYQIGHFYITFNTYQELLKLIEE